MPSFDGGNVEHALRAAVQEQRAVGYVFAGSEPSLMERMLTPRRPFYKAGPVVRLGKIDERMFAEFIDARFAKSGIRTEDGLGAAIVELADNVPYDVQRLAHETWDDVRAAGRKSAGLEDLHLTLGRLLNQQHTVFEEAWQRLTLAQRAVLRAIVLETGASCCRRTSGSATASPRRLQRAVGARRAGPPGHRHEGPGALLRQRLALSRVAGAADAVREITGTSFAARLAASVPCY